MHQLKDENFQVILNIEMDIELIWFNHSCITRDVSSINFTGKRKFTLILPSGYLPGKIFYCF